MSSLDELTVKPYKQRINNWSNTVKCYPQLIFEPINAEEVQLIVREARRQGRKIRPVGEHTSPGEGFATDDWMLKLSRISHLHANTDKGTATIGAGLTVRKANKKLYELGLSFPAIGSIDEISVGALFTTADHGSSIYTASTSDRAYACTLVTADGRIRQVRKDSQDKEESDLFRATGAGCGATGVVVDITFQLDEAFGLAPIYEQICMRDVLAKGSGEGGLVDIAKKNEFVKIWYFPNTTPVDSHKPDSILWRADRVAPPPYPKPNTAFEDVQKKFIHILHATGVFICTYLLPFLMPSLNTLMKMLQSRGLPMKQEPIAGPLAQLMDCLYWQLVQEWGIPITKNDDDGAIRALRDLMEFLDHDRAIGGGLTAPFEIRFSKTADTYWLSPLSHPDAEAMVWLEPIVYKPLNLPVPQRYTRLFKVLDDIGRTYGGKPHVAKPRRTSNQKELHDMYEHIDAWNRIVRSVDPTGIFWSDSLQAHFGTVDS